MTNSYTSLLFSYITRFYVRNRVKPAANSEVPIQHKVELTGVNLGCGAPNTYMIINK